MRTLFAAMWALVMALLGCQRGGNSSAVFPSFSSSELVLVPDASFWSGCAGSVGCSLVRLEILKISVEMWKEVFPDMRISISSIPVRFRDSRHIVTISVHPTNCNFSKQQWEKFTQKKLTPVACYQPDKSAIVILKEQSITSAMLAHEIGHALGLDHHPDDVLGAIMSEPFGSEIKAIDEAALCRLYPSLVGCLPPASQVAKKED